MGILSSITKAFYKVADPILTTIAKPVDVVKAAISPTKTVKQVQDEFFSQSKLKQSTQFATNALIAGTAVLSGTAALAGSGIKKVVPSVAKALVPKSTKGKVIAAVAAPIAIGAATSNPLGVAQVVQDTPSSLVNVGQNIGKFAADPSVETAKNIIKDNPVITSAAGAGLALAGAGLVIPAVGGAIQGALTRNEIENQTKALLDQKPDVPVVTYTPIPQGSAPQTPITPETKPLIATAGSSTSTKRKYKRRKPVIPSVKQSVRVLVQNKNYIKRSYH